jgi:hypothetical protein
VSFSELENDTLNQAPQDRAKTNKANKKPHTKHYNDEPQDRAKTNKANNKHHTTHYNDHCSVLCGVYCLLCLSSLYLVWPIIVVFCVVFIVKQNKQKTPHKTLQ